MRLGFAAGLAAVFLSASAHAQTHVETRRDDDLVRHAALAMLSTYVVNLWTAEIGDIA